MIAAYKERQERMKRALAESKAAAEREAEEKRRKAIEAKRLLAKPPRIVWEATPPAPREKKPKHLDSAATLPDRLTVKRIIMRVSIHYGISPGEMVGVGRKAKVIIPRFVAYYLATELTKLSLPQIGQQFGSRDHTSVMNGRERIKSLMEYDPDLKANVDFLRADLLEEAAPAAGDPALG